MKKIFSDSGHRKKLDSRLEPSRYKKLQYRYLREIRNLSEKDKVEANFLGVQCEHCHGVRLGHPGAGAKTLKKVSMGSCRECHHQPHAKEFDPAIFSKAACPISNQ